MALPQEAQSGKPGWAFARQNNAIPRDRVLRVPNHNSFMTGWNHSLRPLSVSADSRKQQPELPRLPSSTALLGWRENTRRDAS